MESTQVIEVIGTKNLTKGHVLYFYESLEKYISNVVDFILSGLKQNEYSIIVENDRITPLIKKRLTMSVKANSLEKVMFINNYDFYYAKGDFRINSIFDYFLKFTEGDPVQDAVLRSWAHVEWRDEREISGTLLASENEADKIVSETNLLSVCAYDSTRVSIEFMEGLLDCHNYLISEKE
ncbi:MEDS domain-containing protein [Peribacillus kribbensis]|uniref:MEDS domain-containing protein n=1 Tax=Peribacillus kribbensis TaxID=356658 RepID=UPI00040A1D22|nr:MEDS domain-containing protein [Peribacillus kribbensis]